jgi:hypothetical protein
MIVDNIVSLYLCQADEYNDGIGTDVLTLIPV